MAEAPSRALPNGDIPKRTQPLHFIRLIDRGTIRTGGNLKVSETQLLLSKWKEENTTVLCLGSFNECRLVIKAHVLAVTEESFTMRSIKADSTLTFYFGSEGTTFDYAEQREFGIEKVMPELAQLSSIAISFPVRIALSPNSEMSERETLILVELLGPELDAKPD